MKEFFKDYYTMLIVPQGLWMKKHWLGYILSFVVISIVIYVTMAAWARKINYERIIFPNKRF